jgi:ribosomal protein L16 Arg81 hydroxylase
MMIDFRCDYEQFKTEFFEKKPILIEDAFTPPVFPLKIVEDALAVVDPSETYLKVLKNAERIDHSLLTEEYLDIGVRRRRIRKDALYHYLADDASLVLNRIDLYSPIVSDICLQVSRFAKAQASANAYVSFGREPATDVHWDRHDIFAIQLLGEKRWEIFKPTFELPLNSQTSSQKKSQVPAVAELDIILKAGDVLYLPRGWWHRVTPVENKPTLHLAIGAHTPLLLDYLIWACGNKLPDHLPFRKSVNSVETDDGQLEIIIAKLSDILIEKSTFQDFLQRAQSRERVNSHMSLTDVFLPNADGEKQEPPLQINSRYEPGKNLLLINGQQHSLTPAERMAVDFVASHPAATTGDVREKLSETGCKFPTEVLSSLMKRDIISHILNF